MDQARGSMSVGRRMELGLLEGRVGLFDWFFLTTLAPLQSLSLSLSLSLCVCVWAVCSLACVKKKWHSKGQKRFADAGFSPNNIVNTSNTGE